MQVSEGKSEIHYPSVYLENVKAALPHGGTITFRYKACSINEDVKRDRISVSLDLLEIVDVVADKGEEKAKSPGAVLDELAGKKNDAEEKNEYLAEDEDED